ncbi:protein FAM162B isoform X2 [Trematomus bernacchii]|uniref:protein FAM162B isoform X2 n=1 Tax=Trematomus bernacchii TaxID=40690 RepID=UPI00146F5F18|nr:protein FAM162B isoform X2 [Trematomus bernacchii]
MNFVRTRLSLGNFIGQRCRQVTETWSHRGMCSKPEVVKAEPPAAPAAPAAPAPVARASFRVPGYKPSNMDKKLLLWSGRFKTEDQIPEIVSFEMLDAARNKVRVKACYVMVLVSIGACVITVILGKRAAARNETLTAQNMEKKARWREEMQREKEAALALSEKAQ